MFHVPDDFNGVRFYQRSFGLNSLRSSSKLCRKRCLVELAVGLTQKKDQRLFLGLMRSHLNFVITGFGAALVHYHPLLPVPADQLVAKLVD